MTAYNHRVNQRHRVRRLKNTNRALYTLLFIVVVATTGVSVFFWQQNSKEPPVVELKPRAAGAYFGAAKKPYANEVFQFASQKDWIFSPESSDIPSKYVFYSQNNGLVEYEVRIYLDREGEYTATNYIVPVTVKAGALEAQTVSPLCTTLKKPTPTQTFSIRFGNVSFSCDTNKSRQMYAAGVVGGSYKIPLYNSRGELRQVIFNYTNHRTIQDSSIFSEILESFKLK